MAYVTPAAFRTATIAEYAAGLTLSTTEVPSTGSEALLTATIARVSQQVDDWCNDRFETVGESDFPVWSDGLDRLLLPRRTQAVYELYTIDEDGDSTLQDDGVYRLSSSLDADGARAVKEFDYIDLIPLSDGLDGTWTPFRFDRGDTVRINADFGYLVTPPQIKRLVCLLVWDHWKERRGDLRRAEVVSNQNETIRYAATDPQAGVYTGIPEADGIIAAFKRESYLAVG